MPKRVDYKNQRNFTGGLWLNRDAFVLDDEATPDCMNVDMDGRGGFYLRRGVEPYRNAATASNIHSLLSYATSVGTNDVLVGNGTALQRWNGSAWTNIFSGVTGPYRNATFKDRTYVVSKGNSTRRWDGSTSTSMTDPAPSSWNDNLASPTVPPSNGKFPKASCAVPYQNVMMVGNVTENATNYPCRVRWSHPGYPEDWVSTHYVDIEPEDGDEITAMVPLQDRLIVFKHNSIHAIYGTPPEDFSVAPIARTVGAASQEAVVATDIGVFFWDERTGLHQLISDPTKGTMTQWVWEPLWPAIEDGRIGADNMKLPKVGWLNRRVWVGVPWESGTNLDRTFVYDPFVGKKGAWTMYDLAVGPFLEHTPPAQTAVSLAAGGKRLLLVDQFDRTTDDFGSGDVHIDSYYRTRWWDLKEPVVKKRWKRPEVVMLAGQEAEINVFAFRDYDSTHAYKNFHLTTQSDTGGAQFDVDNWDEVEWAGTDGDQMRLRRGSPLGNAKAVALLFEGPQTNVNWRIDSLTLKWVARRVRN